MFTCHITDELAPYIDSELAQADVARVEGHLAICSPCRQKREVVRQGIAFVDDLALLKAPDAIWFAIEDALRERRRPAPHLRWALAVAAILVLGSLVYWSVARQATGWIETNATSRKTLTIGGIGSVELSPNTRIRIVANRPAEHRMALAHGEILAKISAPPRLFFVETASGTAVDLGCEYTLTADDQGAGFLRVSRGWVSYQWNARESLVPAGASCRTHTQSGPGTPYFDDAADKLRRAIDIFDAGDHRVVAAIVSSSRVRDTLTLWHLLSRVDAADRARVFDGIAALTPIPAGVSRERALQLDSTTLKLWKEELAWSW